MENKRLTNIRRVFCLTQPDELAKVRIEAENQDGVKRIYFECSGYHNYFRITVSCNDLRKLGKEMIEAAEVIDSDPDFK